MFAWSQVRHINTGYLTMHVKAKGQRAGRHPDLALRPSLAPPESAADAHAAHVGALLRRRLRVQRRQMLSLRSDAMAWSPLLKEELCICNLLGLLRVVVRGPALESPPTLAIGSTACECSPRRAFSLPGHWVPS